MNQDNTIDIKNPESYQLLSGPDIIREKVREIIQNKSRELKFHFTDSQIVDISEYVIEKMKSDGRTLQSRISRSVIWWAVFVLSTTGFGTLLSNVVKNLHHDDHSDRTYDLGGGAILSGIILCCSLYKFYREPSLAIPDRTCLRMTRYLWKNEQDVLLVAVEDYLNRNMSPRMAGLFSALHEAKTISQARDEKEKATGDISHPSIVFCINEYLDIPSFS